MLELKNISKKYNDFEITNIDLSLAKGEYFVILGPTGTGKTIILEIIAGLIKEDTGSILFKGQNITNLSPESRKVAMVYQDYMLFPHLNVKENIIFGLKISKEYSEKTIKKKLKDMLELFEIKNLLYRNIKTLSGGEKQRVALARALITSPEVLLLDEPLSALDPKTGDNIINELKKIHNKLGTTTIHVTHNFVEALTLADRIAIMNNGQIEQQGKANKVFQKPASNFVANFLRAKNVFQVQASGKNHALIKGKETDLKIRVIDNFKGKANLTIRPEDIIISIDPFYSSARNIFRGIIKEIRNKLNYLEVLVDIGVDLRVNITRQSLIEFELKRDKEVYITFKASAVHIY